MLTYMDVVIENNPYLGGIQITATTEKESLGSATQFKIYRKVYGGAWETIKTVELESVSDLEFSVVDITTQSNKRYSYYFDVFAGDTLLETQSYDFVECWFDGLFIGNENKKYIAGTNVSLDETITTQASYVTTLASRTPYRVSNANTRYSTVNASALFMKLTDDKKKFIPDADHSYAYEVSRFLLDHTNKIIKVGDGRIWYAAIDAAISLPSSENFTGYNMIEFSFTEIGDVPQFDCLVGVD